MNIIESVKVAISAVFANKMRSILTMLGIIIGISSVITIVSLGDGGKSMINQEFDNFALGKIALYLNWDKDYSYNDWITDEDLDLIKARYRDDLISIFPSEGISGTINGRNESLSAYVSGSDEGLVKVQNIDIVHGRTITKEEVVNRKKVGLISLDTAKKIFGRANVVGEDLEIEVAEQDTNFSLGIIGVYKEKESKLMGGNGGSQTVYIYSPYTAVNDYYGTEKYNMVQIQAKREANSEEIKNGIISILERRHDSFGEDLYIVESAEEQMNSINNVINIVTLIIGAIAAISLLVGGIGVMNIMFVSVTERTREIGIRKAIGAKRKDILSQFLVESVIISGIGGIIGTIFGLSISFIVSVFIKIPPAISIKTIAIAWTFSAGVGVFFGIYPANKASKLDPIDALRYE